MDQGLRSIFLSQLLFLAPGSQYRSGGLGSQVPWGQRGPC